MEPNHHQSGYVRPRADGDFPMALIGDAFTLWTKNWKAFTLYGLAANAIPGILIGVGYVLYFIEIFRQTSAQADELTSGVILSMGMIYLGAGLSSLAMIGYYSLAYDALDGRPVTFQSGLDGFRRFLPYLGAMMLSGVVMLIGFVLCYLPGIFAAIALQFVAGIIMDPREEEITVIGSLKRSWTLVKSNWGMAFLWLLVGGIIIQVGFYVAMVGGLISVPIAVISNAMMKRHRAERMDPFPAYRPPTTPPPA